MNIRGSYRALRDNSKAAMLAAIEIYNKPQFKYRDECVSILLINAWELLLKAILSKNKERIYYPKIRKQPYRTYSIKDALSKAKVYYPSDISYEPVAQNIGSLVTYRDNAVHFYNQKSISYVIYGLMQTSIVNYRDLMCGIFDIDIANEITIVLLPLSFGVQPDPIQFLQESQHSPPKNKAAAAFLNRITQITTELEAQKFDTARFLTVYKISIQSVKKISSADAVVAVGDSDDTDILYVERRIDPNISHPLRQKDILEKIGKTLNDVKFTTYTFHAIVWKYGWKENANICWKSLSGQEIKYSNEVPALLKKLSKREIEIALDEYREYQRQRRRKRLLQMSRE